MKVSVKQKDLVSAFKLAGKAKGKNSLVPILDEYLVHVLPNKVTIIAGDLDNFIEVDILSNNADVFSFIVGNQQVKLIEKMDEVVTFEYVNLKLTVSSGKDISNSNPFPVEEYPKIDTIDHTNPFIITNTVQFVDRFAKAKRFTSDDYLRPAMTGINLAFNSGKLEICATDAHKLYTADFEVTGNKEDGSFICKDLVSGIMSSIKTVFSISISRGVKYALFEVNGNVRIISRIIDERYPDYKSVIPENTQSSTVNKKQLLTNIEKSLLFANKTTNKVAFTFFGENVEIHSEDLDYSHEFKSNFYSKNTGIDYPLAIGFNGKYLTSLVKEIETDTVTLLTSLPNRAATIKLPNELYLIMPVMLGEY